jgi:membrane-associated phospholipid phosphatase
MCVGVVVIATALGRRAPSLAISGWAPRLGRGPVGFARTLALGLAVAFAVSLVFGEVAHHLNHSQQSAFDWFASHQIQWWTRLNRRYTVIGNVDPVRKVALLSAVVLAVAYRRRWWFPPLMIAAALATEQVLRMAIAQIVYRGDLPSIGSFPSGGCSRILAVYGIIVWLTLHVVRAGPRVRLGAWTALALMVVVEGWTRIYLGGHFFLDVPGGWVFGTLLLLTLIQAARTLEHKGQPAVRV